MDPHPGDPRRWLSFVQLDPFPPAWKKLGLDDDDLRSLEIAIIADPERAAVVPGTGGLRKLRFAPVRWRTGKRGALRVCYVYFRRFGLVALLTAYGKSGKDDLTADEKKRIRSLIGEVSVYLESRGKRTRPGTQP